MTWLVDLLRSSIGKKLMMALTGLFFCFFLTVHLIGNLTLYGGGGMFNSYAEHLHALGPVLVVAELGMIFFALVHVATGLTLFFQNRQARPHRYAVNKAAGGRTVGSGTMPYTGLLMLAFVIVHLFNFTFVDKAGRTIYDVVSMAFGHPFWVVFYLCAVILVAVHVSHGFWSAFQTVGVAHPKYTPLLRGLAVLFSVMVGLGFGSIPLYLAVAG